MAVPGFSVSDLIQALGQVKLIYDAFFNEYTNTALQVRDLADDIDQFRRNLQKHRDIVERAELEYSGYEAVQRTLASCYRFLDGYKIVLDKGTRRSVVGVLKTTKFTFDQEEVNRLRTQIGNHKTDILHYSMNLVLETLIPGRERISPNTPSNPVTIAGQSPNAVSPSSTPPLLGSPRLKRDGFAPQSPTSPSGVTPPNQRPLPLMLDNTATNSPQSPQAPSNIQSPIAILGSSPNQRVPRTTPTGISIPDLVLPQSALPYQVAEVHFGNKKVDLRRKATGRDAESGRELVIVDEYDNLRFRHRIKAARNEPCYPYTWHQRWRNQHHALEITFKGIPAEAHSISFKGAPASFAIPKYIFAEQKDFTDFQSEVRGKHLEDTFDVRQIACASSSKNGEATDQHLKVWMDYHTREYSVSFYASAIEKPRHMEFPLAMFEQQIGSKSDFELCLNFIGYGESKRARTFSKAFSRSPTERSASSAGTTVPSVFTRNNTGIASSASSTTTMSTTSNPRASIASFASDGSSTERSKSFDSLEMQAKSMKYLRIEFSSDEEIVRFKTTYARLYQEETARPLDLFLNWQLNAAQQRPESVTSYSPSGTPFTMSPELRPIRNPNGSA